MRFIINDPTFEYDIRGLLMAFFPGEKLDISEESEEKDQFMLCYTDLSENEKKVQMEVIRQGEKYTAEEVLDLSDRKEAKSVLKRKLYRLLSEVTNKTLPWGTLTGIRPTKIPMAMMMDGKSDLEIDFHMEEELLCSKEKTLLSKNIAKRELQLLNTLDTKNGYSLYIGIPFCPSICLYCSFSSYELSAYKKKVPLYLETLKKEISYVKEAFKDKTLDTIYFGGGTPTTLSSEELDELLSEVVSSFDLTHCKEWTIEAGRPDSVTREKLEVIKKYPVTRISINPQTMHQKTLDLIGRKHTVTDVRNVFSLAREIGFTNINMDLIFGLPGETEEDILETVKEVIEMDPDNVTIHSLAVKRSSRLHYLMEEYKTYRMENSDELMSKCEKMLSEKGLMPYYLYRQKNMAGNLENVGYAKIGKEGIYNILIMEEVQSIVALGAGASTKRVFSSDRIERAENVKEVNQYIERIDEMIERKKTLFSLE